MLLSAGGQASGRYLFRPDPELLELQAMEMDEGLRMFFDMHLAEGEAERVFTCVNGEGLERKLKVNRAERMLQGRGIKGFFAPYTAAGWLTIEMLADGRVQIAPLAQPDATALQGVEVAAETRGRIQTVLDAMALQQRQDDVWFELYDRSRSFRSTTTDLICLPHLRDIEPFQYQVKAVQTVIGRLKGRAMLCDEVGLGKTIEAGICLQEYVMRGLARKILILAPPSLTNQWSEELRRKFNQDFIRSDDPVFTALGEEAWERFPKVIASIATAKRARHARAIAELHYDLVIVDEAHHVKNRNTVAWKFVNQLKKKYMLLLTATPVQNSLEELYNLITLLKPGQLQTYSQFRKNFVEDNQGIEVKNADKLKALLTDVMIRNRRSNVDVIFTKRQASTRIVSLRPEEQRLYAALSQFVREQYTQEHPVFSRFLLKSMQEMMGSSFGALAGTLAKLAADERLDEAGRRTVLEHEAACRELAASESAHSAKIAALIEIVEAFGDKMLIFTKYRSTQELLVQAMRERGYRVAEFHGGLKRIDKEREIAEFRGEAQLLISTEVGGEGRNLQFCNGMINFDLPWNPMAIEQRIGRIHRVGQTRDVHVFNLAAEHTLEHHMLNILDRKINLFELVVGEVDMILGDLEDSEDFSDRMMEAWVRSADETEIARGMEEIGELLLDNKNKLERVKSLDDRIFA